MRNVKCWARVEWYGELPDDDGQADLAFDRMCDYIDTALNAEYIDGTSRGSFSITDGDAVPE